MIDAEKMAENWLKLLEPILADYPSEFAKVVKLCEQKKYNVAFMFVDEIFRLRNIERTNEFEKVATDFYFSVR